MTEEEIPQLQELGCDIGERERVLARVLDELDAARQRIAELEAALALAEMAAPPKPRRRPAVALFACRSG